MIYKRRVSRETPDLSYDGRNGYPIIIETVFEIVETAPVFNQEVFRVLCVATDEEIATRIVNALNKKTV